MTDAPVVKIAITGANSISATNMTKTDTTHYYYIHTVSAGDGSATVALSVGTDSVGNVITSAPTSGATFTVDNTAPNAPTIGTFTPTGGTVTAGYLNSTNTGFTLTFTSPAAEYAGTAHLYVGGSLLATDITTTVSAGNTVYTLTGNAQSITDLGADGAKALTVKIIDAAGNVGTASGASNITKELDAIAPTTTSNIDSSWHTGSVTVSLTCTDNLGGSGCANTYYSTNGGNSYTSGTSFTISADGTYSVKYYSTDGVGNSETANSAQVKIDKTAPSTPGTPTTSLSPTTVTKPTWGWTASTDAGSGLAPSSTYTVAWCKDSSYSGCDSNTSTTTDVSYTHTTALTDGLWYFRVKSADAAGNTSSWSSSGSVTIDTTAPASLTLSSPSDGSYTNSERPTFTWKGVTDTTSGIDSYSLTVDNGDSTSFTIDPIPTTGNSSTSTYTLTNDGTYLSLVTKSSSLWGTLNDGKLKEGKRTWTVKATDKVGNSTQQSSTVYADFTSPSLSSVSVSSIEGTKDNYQVMISTSPTFSGTTSDNLYPDKIEINYYKQNYFFGVLTSTSLVLTQSYSLTSNSANTNISFSIPSSQPLDYGDYQIDVVAIDKASNKTTKSLPQIKLMTSQQAQVLLKSGNLTLNKDSSGSVSLKEETPLSLPALEKKAILRREIEAQNLKPLTDVIASIEQYITQTFHALMASISFMVNQTVETLAYAKDVIFGGTSELARELASIIPNSVKVITQVIVIRPLEGISSAIGGLNNTIWLSSQVLSKSLNQSQNNVQKHVDGSFQGLTKKLKDTSTAFTMAMRSLQKPVNDSVSFLDRAKIWVLTFESIVIDPAPTKISDVAIEKVGRDSAVVSWKTNHYALGKVNYGEDLKYGHEVFLDNREKYHQATLTGLQPGKRYFFEVMSQNKNYVYDAYYSFETKK